MKRSYPACYPATSHNLPGQFWKSASTAGVLMLSFSLPAIGQAAAPAVTCESLAKAALPGVTITSAQTVAAGELKIAPAAPLPPGAQAALGPQGGKMIPGTAGAPAAAPSAVPAGGGRPRTDLTKLPDICRVQATVLPSPQDEAKLEVWLPTKNWNGATLTVTHPTSSGGNINAEVVSALRDGYGALLNMSPSFDDWITSAKSGDQLVDQGYRTGHEMLVAAKSIARAYYGAPVKRAYYEGCSEGGREGFSAAQHYPNDYDGLIVGASGNQFARINLAQIFPSWLVTQNRARIISKDEWGMIHKAVLNVCDQLDGVKDNIINDPRQCHWEPDSLLCKGDKNDACLTAQQIEALKAIYLGPVNPRTKEVIFPGPVLGGELQLPDFSKPDAPIVEAVKLFRYPVKHDPSWDFRTMDLDKDFELAMRNVQAIQTTPADLKDFVDHGGKMIIWDGWNDFNNPKYWIQYYEEMQKLFGAGKVGNKVQMYFLPGVQHCGGGEGADSFNKLDAIAGWITTGNAPDLIHSSKIADGKTIMTRPVCSYPQVSKYNGAGDPNDEKNWSCVAAKPGL